MSIQRNAKKTPLLYVSGTLEVEPRHPVSNIPLFRIYLVHQFNGLLVHGKHNASAHYQPSQPWKSSTPESEHALILEDQCCTMETILVQVPRFDALHPSLDCIQWLRDVHGDETCHAAYAKGCQSAEFLSGRGVRLCQLA